MSDLVDQCPLPELAEALRPYIKPREEIAEIRRGIDSLLSQHIKDDNIPISKVTLSIAETSAQSTLNSPFNGARRAFMQALIARQKAQSQYDTLKAELDLLQHTPTEKENHEKENSVANTVALIRQRQRRDKLLVIDKALDDLEKVRHTSRYADPSELLNGMQSQIPPPLAQQSQDESLAEAQSHVFELQKAVLRAQSTIQSTPRVISSQKPVTEEWKRAYALRRARDELIAWIEDELAKLSVGEEHDDLGLDMQGDIGAESRDEIKTTLSDLYNKYITSRERLIRILNTQYTETDSIPAKPLPEGQQLTTSDKPSNTAALASEVLPFIGILRSTAQEEAALMQHTSYLRRQITTVSAETEQLLVRLSDESHMVRPGTSHTTAWAEAARDTRSADKDIIHSRLVTGETSIDGVRKVLASAQMSR